MHESGPTSPRPGLPPTPPAFPPPTLPSIDGEAGTGRPDSASGSEAVIRPASPSRPKRPFLVAGLATLAITALAVAGFVVVGTTDISDTDGTIELATDAPAALPDSGGFSYAAASETARDADSMSVDTIIEDRNGTLRLAARVDRASERVELDVDMSEYELDDVGPVLGDSIGMIIDGESDTVYITANMLGALFGEGLDGWIAIESAAFDGSGGFDQVLTNPLTITDVLGDLDPVDLGDEEIEGETMRHYQVTTDARTLAESSGAPDSTFGREVDDSTDVRYDVWISADDRVRRISFEMPDPGSGDLATVTIDVETSDGAAAIDIALPASDDVVDIDDLFGDLGFDPEG